MKKSSQEKLFLHYFELRCFAVGCFAVSLSWVAAIWVALIHGRGGGVVGCACSGGGGGGAGGVTPPPPPESEIPYPDPSQTRCLGKILTKKRVFKAFLSDFQTSLRHFSESCPTQIFGAAHVCFAVSLSWVAAIWVALGSRSSENVSRVVLQICHLITIETYSSIRIFIVKNGRHFKNISLTKSFYTPLFLIPILSLPPGLPRSMECEKMT